MKKNIFYSLMLLLVAFVSGCSDRLDIPKNGNMGGIDDFYQTDQEVDEALATLYVGLKSNYYNWWFVKNSLSDDAWAGGGSRGDNGEMEKLNEYRFGADESMIQALYSGLYTGHGTRCRSSAAAQRIPPGQQHTGTVVGMRGKGSE